MSDAEVPLTERQIIEQIRREVYLLDVNATEEIQRGVKSLHETLAVTGRGIRWNFLEDIFCMWVMEACLIPSRSKAQLEGLSRRQLPFMRTFKKG